MPRFKTHLAISAATGVAYSLVLQSRRQDQNPDAPRTIDLLHVIGCAISAAAGGCVPDKLEPADRATGPDHRGAIHSWTTCGIALKGALRFPFGRVADDRERLCGDLAGAFCAGFVSHLIADAFTPDGLNFIAKKC